MTAPVIQSLDFPKTAHGQKQAQADAHWRMGKNTAQIARVMRTDEPVVVKLLDEARAHRLRLPLVQYEQAGQF